MNVDHAKVIAACMALCGFAVSIVAGLAAENSFDLVLTRALASLVACYLLGFLVGAAAQHVFAARVAELQQQAQAGSPGKGSAEA